MGHLGGREDSGKEPLSGDQAGKERAAGHMAPEHRLATWQGVGYNNWDILVMIRVEPSYTAKVFVNIFLV